MTDPSRDERATQLFEEHRDLVYRRTDRMFLILMIAQWVFAIVLALTYSPYGWAGKQKAVHLHVQAAIILGGILTALPVCLLLFAPGKRITRNVVAIAQMLWSALLIHLSGGRIETHFHVFGSLAFLAFYRDWTVLLPATVVVAADHLVRQLLWPESVYGIPNPEWWRFIEHAFWVVFEDTVLIAACILSVSEMRAIARTRAEMEVLSRTSERAKTEALGRAREELRASQESLVRAERLAAVGQLAASVGHELRNPLAAARNATTYVGKRLRDLSGPQDPRVAQFVGLIDRELVACTKIISDLLDFARERPPAVAPCPLRPLVDEAIALVPNVSGVSLVNEVSDELPIPALDKDQFRQVLINLVQNAAEAIGEGPGRVIVRATGGGRESWRLSVEDNGPGIAPDVLPKIFEPLFTTKTKGTGLGLAIVSSVIARHGGTIRAEGNSQGGTTFHIEVPAEVRAQPSSEAAS